MSAARPTVNVRGVDGGVGNSLPLPAVFQASIRTDVVEAVHKSMAKNKRQAYANKPYAGMENSGISWGTGRAVARIPRISSSGTARSGMATGSNAAAGARSFNPNRVWRRWHVKVAKNQRRFATSAAIAATAIPSLLLARGHRVEEVDEVPLVVSDAVEKISKTKEAIAFLQAVKAYPDVIKVSNSRNVRAGVGKSRNRRHKQRRGPLIVYDGEKSETPLVKAFANVPGVEVVAVERLNLLKLAPGGHVGRFCIWTSSAFSKLDSIFGTYDKPSSVKSGFKLPIAKISQPDVTRLINSTEIQTVLRPAKSANSPRPFTQKKNPLRNRGVLYRLNPFAQSAIRAAIRQQKAAHKSKPKEKKLSANEDFLSQLHSA